LDFQSKWKNFLVEVSSADAMANLRGTAGDKIISAWAYDMLEKAKIEYEQTVSPDYYDSGEEPEPENVKYAEEQMAQYALMMPGKKARNRWGPELKGMIADTVEEIMVPRDITDNQKGAATLWIVRMLRKNPKITTGDGLPFSFRDQVVSDQAQHILDTPSPDYRESNVFFLIKRDLEMFFQYQEFMEIKDLNRIKDSNQLNSIIVKAWKDIEDHQEKQTFLDADEGTEVFRDDKGWFIAALHNRGAACKLGKGTEWCTAVPNPSSDEQDMFKKYYRPDKPLFVLIPKNDPKKEKYQVHYGGRYQEFEFKNIKDIEVDDDVADQLHKLLSDTKAGQKYKIISTYDDVALARDPNISEEEATRIYKDGNSKRLRELFDNPGTPPSLLAKAEETKGVTSGDKKRRVRDGGDEIDLFTGRGLTQWVVTRALILNPSTPTETIVRIIDKFNVKKNPTVKKLNNSDMYIPVLSHPNMPLDILKKILLGKSDYNIGFSWKARGAVFKNPSLDDAFLSEFATEEFKNDWIDILANPNLGNKTFEKMLQSGEFSSNIGQVALGEFLPALLENPKIKPSTIMKLYKIEKKSLDKEWDRIGMTDGNWQTNQSEELLKQIENSPKFVKKENFHKKWKKKLKEQTTILGLSNKYNNLGQAINEKKVVTIFYEGDRTVSRGARAIEPVVLGTHFQSGNPVVRAWQIQGASDTPDNLPGWRMFRVDRISRLKVTENTFDTPRPQYDPNDDHIASQDATAQFGAALQERKRSRLKLAIYEQKVVKNFKQWRKFVKEAKSRKEKDLDIYGALKKVAKKKEQERFGTEKEKAYAQRGLEKGNENYNTNIYKIVDYIGMDKLRDFFDIDLHKMKVTLNMPPEDFDRENIGAILEVGDEIPNDNPLKSNKIVNLLGMGSFGVVFELDNGHALKLFSGGVRSGAAGVEDELSWYKEMKDDQFSGTSRRGELAVYGSGNLETLNFDVGWAEIGQIVPFKSWVKQKGGNPLMAQAHFNGAREVLQDLADSFRPGQMSPDIDEIKKNPSSKDKIAYVKYLLGIVGEHHHLPNESRDGYSLMTFAKMLKEILEVAVRKGDSLVFDEQTLDVHAGNIGFHLADDQPVVFDR